MYATNYAGDLTVVVTEADGSVSTFTVPPRCGAGIHPPRPVALLRDRRPFPLRRRQRSVQRSDRQHGLTNALTFNLGNQLADGYRAMMLGGVYSSWLGAFGMGHHLPRQPAGRRRPADAAPLLQPNLQPDGHHLIHRRLPLLHRRLRDLSDVLGVRRAATTGQNWQSDLPPAFALRGRRQSGMGRSAA